MLTGGDAGTGRSDDLLHDGARLLLVVPLGGGQERLEFLAHHLGDDPRGRGGAEHFLGLALELGLRESYGHDGGEPFHGVVLDDVVLGDAQQLARPQHLVDRLGDRSLEAGDVGAALGRRDDVDERLDRRVVAGAPAQRDIDAQFPGDLGRCHVTAVVEDRHGLLEGALAAQPEHIADGLVLREVLAEFADAAVVAERLFSLSGTVDAALVTDHEGQARHEEGRLAGAGVQRLQGELGVLEEDLPVGPVAHPGAGLRLGDPLALEQAVARVERGVGARFSEDAGDAAAEADRMRLAAAVHLDVQPGGQGVDDRGADTVQTAGGRVRAAAELSMRRAAWSSRPRRR